jgi:hypothetical protein
VPIFFNHVTKTAGTMVQTVLEQCAPHDRILSSQWRQELGAEQIHLLRHNYLTQFEIVMGHFGESVRRTYFPDHLSVIVFRDPVKRFQSLLYHTLRDPISFGPMHYFKDDLAGKLRGETAREEWLEASQVSFLCPVFSTGLPVSKWLAAHKSFLDILNDYDIVLTERGLSQGLSLLLALFGRSPLRQTPQVNARANFLQGDVAFPPDLSAQLREIGPEEFALYEAAIDKEERLLQRLHTEPLELIFELQGRRAYKHGRYMLDWKDPPPNLNWSSIQVPDMPGMDTYPSRLILGSSASLYLPLAAEERSIQALVWTSDPAIYSGESGLVIRLNGRQATYTAFFPMPPDTHLARLVIPIEPARPLGWTQLEFQLPDTPKCPEFWLMDLSSAPSR